MWISKKKWLALRNDVRRQYEITEYLQNELQRLDKAHGDDYKDIRDAIRDHIYTQPHTTVTVPVPHVDAPNKTVDVSMSSVLKAVVELLSLGWKPEEKSEIVRLKKDA